MTLFHILFFKKKEFLEELNNPETFNYKYSTIELFFYAIKRMAKSNSSKYGKEAGTSCPIPKDVVTKALSIIHELKDKYNNKINEEDHIDPDHNEPCMVQDLHYLIHQYPDICLDKPRDCSLFSSALHFGARCITMANICLRDIVCIIATRKTSDDVQLYAVCLRLRVTKNDRNWQHSVTIEGSLDVLNPDNMVDPVYWLESYLVNTFKVSLRDLLNKKQFFCWEMSDEDRSRPLWPVEKTYFRFV